MEFKNYDEMIKKNRSALINSFVNQYGEENRAFIEDRFDHIRFCFYENPRKLDAFIEKKSIDLAKKYTIDFFEQAGFDVSKIYETKDGSLTSDDIGIKRLIHAFFPPKGYMSMSNNGDGIYSFSSQYSEDTDFNLLRKGILLTEMNYIKSPKEISTYRKTKQYAVIEEMIKTLLPLAQRYRQRLYDNFEDLRVYQRELADNEKNICNKHIRDLVLRYKLLLSTEDMDILTANPDYDLRQLKSVSGICNLCNTGKELPLECGLLEYFLPMYTLELNSKDTLDERKKFILGKRLEFLRLNNITLDLNNEEIEKELTSDWLQIPGVDEVMPDISLIKELKSEREEAQKKCIEELAPLYVINGYNFKESAFDNKDLKSILYLGELPYGCGCTADDGGELTVYISPLDGNYKGLDVILDRQIRQALEFTISKNVLEKDMFGLKKGSEVEFVKVGLNCIMYINGNRAGHANTNINEVMSQKLSIESTTERFNSGVFILVNPEDAELKGSSYYDAYVDNFDAVFPTYIQDKLFKLRINCDNLNPLYEIVPQKLLTQVDDIIASDDKNIKAKLEELRMQMAVRYSFK